MPTAAETDIINSATPLEMRLEGVHPRLYATADRLDAVRERLSREPYAGFLQRVRAVADRRAEAKPPTSATQGDTRGVGCGLTHIAAAYRMTGERRYLTAAQHYLAAMADTNDWGTDLIFGHWTHGVALAYDWLHDELDSALRNAVATALRERAYELFEEWGLHHTASGNCYAWNHMAVPLAGMMAAGCALWGDVPDIGRLLRMGLEKIRLMVDALGPDGASAEGLAYGQYHNDFLLKAMHFSSELLGMDFFPRCEFYRSYPLFMLYSALPRNAWQPGKAFIHLGDASGDHWYGPDAHLRLVASRYRDGHAQWLADELARAGVNADSSCFLNLLWHDETIAPQPPGDLPPMHHLIDKDIVLLRSGWDDRASVFAIKCGPNAGHHGSRNYRQDVSGGHMHPDAGHVLIHARGQWLIVDDGYTFKRTSYQNTVLVNGVGQEGEESTWFEDLAFRRGKPEGRILRAEQREGLDYVIADAQPPYKDEATLTRFLRHVIYLRPDLWVLVDELEARKPSTFELRFHGAAPFEAGGDSAWRLRQGDAVLRVLPLGPTPTAGGSFVDDIEGVGSNHPSYQLPALRLTNAEPTKAAVFVTMLHARDATEHDVTATLDQSGGDLRLNIERQDGATRLTLRPGQADPAAPILGR